MQNSSKEMNERMGFFKIIKESLKIPFKNPNFILFTFLTSVPLFYLLAFNEIILQHILIQTVETAKLLKSSSDIDDLKILLENVYPKGLLLCLLCLGELHFIDLFTTITTVDVASIIYTGQKSISFKDMFCRTIKETRFRGPIITSLWCLLLAALIFLGLFSLATYMNVVLFIALSAKYIEWSAIWNMGIVISILEDKQGDVALLISSYLSRGKRVCGFFVMLGFLAGRFGLRFYCLYKGWDNGGSSLVVTAVHISLVCLANLLKWLAIMVYFYDCKKQSTYDYTAVEEANFGNDLQEVSVK